MGARATGVSPAAPLAQLSQRLTDKTARIGVIGLGYVGLPLAVEFAREGFRVTGIDVDERRIGGVNQGRSYIPDVPSDDLVQLVKQQRLSGTAQFDRLDELDAIIICVPTPLRKTREPDISYIISASTEIAKWLRAGQLIVLESTTYPGTTDEVILPLLQAKGLTVGKEFSLAFSPERIDPGNPQFQTRNIPKVVGGTTPACTQLVAQLYSQIIERVVPVSSTKAAEMAKLLENTFRAVNIGLVNEIALMCDKLGVDVWEVIDAAKTKPFGFMAFYPGPGIGGHCIPSDPMYLAWKARVHGFEARFIELADQTNRYMPHHVADRVARALNLQKKALNGSKVLLLGLAYKRDVNDTRASPAFAVAQELLARGADVAYHDPFVAEAQLNGQTVTSVALSKALLQQQDCAVILTDHSSVDYALIAETVPMVVDTRNIYGRSGTRRPNVIRL